MNYWLITQDEDGDIIIRHISHADLDLELNEPGIREECRLSSVRVS